MTVVRTTPPASAGSIFMRLSITGIRAPASAPANRLSEPGQRRDEQVNEHRCTDYAANAPVAKPKIGSRRYDDCPSGTVENADHQFLAQYPPCTAAIDLPQRHRAGANR